MTNIVIVAGGKQTRYNELSVFPKVLLPSVEQSSLLTEVIKKTTDLDVTRHLVINRTYSEQITTYLKVNNLQDEIQVIESTNTNGSLNTLREVRKSLPSKNVLFIWSDLSLTSFKEVIEACEKTSGDGIVFTNALGQYRYKTLTYKDMFESSKTNFLSEAIRVSDYSGNVPGIYFLRSLDLIKPFKDGHGLECKDTDLLDEVNNNAQKKRYQVIDLEEIDVKLIEYRDIKVYKDLLKNNCKENVCQTRFFNKLVIDHEHKTAVKQVIDNDYQHLLQKEVKWYKLYDELNRGKFNCTPKVFSSDECSFTMEYLEGYQPLHVVLDRFEKACDISKVKQLYENILLKVSECQGISSIQVPIEVFKEDLKKEIVDKVIDRCEKIRGFLLKYDRIELETLLKRVYDQLISFAMNSNDADVERGTLTYGFCHGDLNGSNTMVDPETLDVKFIDPRGYFGNTEMYGWKPYELAKILYCLYGYDDFNLKPQIYMTDWPQIRQSLEYSGIKEYFHHCDYQHYVDLVGVIYVALAGYISQDVMKANIAYEYGMRILKR